MLFQDTIIVCTALILTQYIFKLLANLPNQINKINILYPNISVFLKEVFLFLIDVMKFTFILIVKIIIMLFVIIILYCFKYYIDDLMYRSRYKYAYFL